jgi:aryl-alcohol dehydrogenase-like predicted oxidoreductase
MPDGQSSVGTNESGLLMQYRKLGHDGPKVSALGFGGWPMGGSRYGAKDDGEGISAVQCALETGVTLFDTAVAYGLGHSESILGRALKNNWNDVVVVTKTGIVWEADRRIFVRDSRPASIRSQCEDSLRALGTDRIDVYLIHWPDPDTPIDETMREMERLRTEGKIGYVGVSNFSTDQMDEARKVLPIVANQVGYHMLDRRHADKIIPYCAAQGIGVMAYGSLAHGVLTGTFDVNQQFADDDWRKPGYAFGLPLFHPDFLADTLEAVDEITSAARSADLTTAQMALRWVLNEPAVSTALVGFRNPSEVDLAVAAVEASLPYGVMDGPNAATLDAYRRLRAAEQPQDSIGPGRRAN